MPNLPPERHDLLVQIARLYYLKSMTHQQIADKLGLSRVKVTRLLQEAVSEGLVVFKIADPVAGTVELQEQLEKKFGLKRAIVTLSGQDNKETYDMLGRYAGKFLTDNLKDGMKIGLGWGRTLNAMLPYLRRTGKKDITVVSMTGGLAANDNQPNPYDVATSIAAGIGARARYMIAPAIVDNVQVKELLLQEANVRDVTALWKELDLCMMSIGVPSTETGIFYSFADPEAEVQKTREKGAVGDLLAHPLDEHGKFVSTDFIERTMSIDFADVKKASVVAGVAGGRHKAEAILGALRSGYLTVLITDENSAQRVLELNE